VIDWEAKQARCPQGQTSVKWTPGRDVSGDPVVRIRFDTATCRACPARRACTWAKDAPRQLTVRPQAHHEAIQAARQRQETAEFQAQYAQRAGIEGTHLQGIRRCGLRQSRYMGLAGWLLRLYGRWQAAGMLAAVVAVGVVTLLWSPQGFIGVAQADRQAIRTYSLYLLLIAVGAFLGA
jgi:hypothetical protein